MNKQEKITSVIKTIELLKSSIKEKELELETLNKQKEIDLAVLFSEVTEIFDYLKNIQVSHRNISQGNQKTESKKATSNMEATKGYFKINLRNYFNDRLENIDALCYKIDISKNIYVDESILEKIVAYIKATNTFFQEKAIIINNQEFDLN
jgi:hypothetical protein